MEFHYMGKYDLNPESLPYKPHKPEAVPFKEPKDSKTLGLIASVLGLILLIPLAITLYLRCGNDILKYAFLGCIISLFFIFPHELLHAIFFKEDVYLYTNFKHGCCLLSGPKL